MDGKMLARLVTIIFVGVAITATVIELTRKEGPEVHTLSLRRDGDADPLQHLLRRCRDMGEAATGDAACLKVWAANRDRFLRQNAEALQTTRAPNATPSAWFEPAPEPVPVNKETAPVMQPEPARPGSH
ncbi:putative entry exclusion protein TrbK-alt [Pseudaminobacter soli (ex Li et al. 2025)]|uniref:Conjugal transfer protein TrbK n=1 Tax=Pseudaminobacter soli (ex Li et al. 2025) TaxID=1295366 RepID=A0A2P7S1A1_9HYPH|nr:putative entry exclusion protein TrbK-alt [Mesorhizobium soli]PSJ56247.1 conjugal transfer protein TrbK [Mesorhizobium soli]